MDSILQTVFSRKFLNYICSPSTELSKKNCWRWLRLRLINDPRKLTLYFILKFKWKKNEKENKVKKVKKKFLLLTLNNSSCFEKNTGVGEKGNSCFPSYIDEFYSLKELECLYFGFFNYLKFSTTQRLLLKQSPNPNPKSQRDCTKLINMTHSRQDFLEKEFRF